MTTAFQASVGSSKLIDPLAAAREAASTAANTPVLQSLGVTEYTIITIDYVADYENAARFMGAIERLPQHVSIGAGEMRREPPRVAGTLTLHVYRKGS